ncbi:DUF167 domain-containing protein [Poriferisphaera sp. WC338]|uniref:DUF167 domain-containing protein n=1 Tax=Poriferisphaera sp. WC338 TaxID=3425129 RepID=UPI003D81980A
MDEVMCEIVKAAGDDVWVRLKVAPGASRTEVVGVLGDRLKVAISAPPEDGKANKMLCEMMARLVGIRKKDCVVVKGQTTLLKTLKIKGVSAREVCRVILLQLTT